MAEIKGYKQINTITNEIVSEVLHLLQNNVYKIVLYGSYARGDFTSESDIDIMILLNCRKEQVMQYRKQISQLSSRIGLKNDIEISLLLRDGYSVKLKRYYANKTFIITSGMIFAVFLLFYTYDSYIYNTGYYIFKGEAVKQICIDLYRFV